MVTESRRYGGYRARLYVGCRSIFKYRIIAQTDDYAQSADRRLGSCGPYAGLNLTGMEILDGIHETRTGDGIFWPVQIIAAVTVGACNARPPQ